MMGRTEKERESTKDGTTLDRDEDGARTSTTLDPVFT